MKNSVGYEVGGADIRSLELLEQALHEFRCFIDNPIATADAALMVAPQLVMAHVFKAWLYLLSTEAAALPLAQQAIASANALPHNEREAMHLRALALLQARNWQAAGLALEDLNAIYPLDGLALQAGQQIDFFRGDGRMLRDRIARVLPHWSAAIPGWHAVLGMAAFGLEETGDYLRAEHLGRQAIECEPRDGWAQHAVAHVMEMQGRRAEGIDWMINNSGWQRDNFLAVHNWWHVALYHLANGDTEQALGLYDGPIQGQPSGVVVELVDASALLWRIQLQGCNVGQRWIALAQRWAPHAGSGHYAFNDWHAAMAFANAGSQDLLDELLQAQNDAIRRDDDNAMFTREVGAMATQGFVAYAQQDWVRALDLLRPIRSHSHRFGGSHAQRDIIDLTLIDAASRAGQSALLSALKTERQTLAEQRRPACVRTD